VVWPRVVLHAEHGNLVLAKCTKMMLTPAQSKKHAHIANTSVIEQALLACLDPLPALRVEILLEPRQRATDSICVLSGGRY